MSTRILFLWNAVLAPDGSDRRSPHITEFCSVVDVKRPARLTMFLGTLRAQRKRSIQCRQLLGQMLAHLFRVDRRQDASDAIAPGARFLPHPIGLGRNGRGERNIGERRRWAGRFRRENAAVRTARCPSAARPTTPTTTKMVRTGKRIERGHAGVDAVTAPVAEAFFRVLAGLRAAMSVSFEPLATQYRAKSSIFHDFATESDYIRPT